MSPSHIAALLTALCLALLALSGRLDFLRKDFSHPALRWLGCGLFGVVLAASVFYPAVSPDQAAQLDPAHLRLPDLFVGHALLSGFLLVWWLLARPQPLLHFLHVDQSTPRDVGRGIWLGAMGWMVTILITAAIAAVIGVLQVPDETPDVPSFMIWMATLPLWQKLIVVVIAMTVEEGFFRAFLQSRIGWIPSSILFALGHASYGLPLMVVSVFIISLVMGWSFRRNGRLLPCIMAHGTFDAIQLFIILPFAVHQLQNDMWDTLAATLAACLQAV